MHLPRTFPTQHSVTLGRRQVIFAVFLPQLSLSIFSYHTPHFARRIINYFQQRYTKTKTTINKILIRSSFKSSHSITSREESPVQLLKNSRFSIISLTELSVSIWHRFATCPLWEEEEERSNLISRTTIYVPPFFLTTQRSRWAWTSFATSICA